MRWHSERRSQPNCGYYEKKTILNKSAKKQSFQQNPQRFFCFKRPSQGYCPMRFSFHTFRRVLLTTSLTRTLSQGFWVRLLEHCLNNLLRSICADFPKGDMCESKLTLATWRRRYFSLYTTPSEDLSILRPLTDTIRGASWIPPGRRGVRGRKPPPFSLVSRVLTRTTKGLRIWVALWLAVGSLLVLFG